MAYYYFMTSLPQLVREAEAPCSEEEFIALVSSHLPPAALEQLRLSSLFERHRAVLGAALGAALDGAMGASGAEAAGESPAPREDIPAARTWLRFEYGLRGEIARMRAVALKRDVAPHWPLLDSFIYREELRRILQQDNPLKIEIGILNIRWDMLDELEATPEAPLDEVVIYYLRLQLLVRRNAMETARAQKQLSAMYDRFFSQLKETITAA